MRPVILTMGVFDGVHRGHQEILRRVVRRAKSIGGIPLAYTFDPHPARVLAPASCPLMIMTLSQRAEALKEEGVRRTVVQRFTRSFSRITPDQFFDRIILRKLKACEVYVGYDFTFGYHRKGTTELLEKLGAKKGVRVVVVEPYLWKETLVSSTQIRQHLSKGLLGPARELLGRPYRMEGIVVRGRGIGGNRLGVHTANLKAENETLLPAGVYASFTWRGKNRHRSVTNIGTNPTFGDNRPSIETHLLNFKKSLLGKRISIEFVQKIREEIRFATADDLAVQIRNDIQRTQHCLKRS